MIRTDDEKTTAQGLALYWRNVIGAMRNKGARAGASEDELDKLTAPQRSRLAAIEEEVATFEAVQRVRRALVEGETEYADLDAIAGDMRTVLGLVDLLSAPPSPVPAVEHVRGLMREVDETVVTDDAGAEALAAFLAALPSSDPSDPRGPVTKAFTRLEEAIDDAASELDQDTSGPLREALLWLDAVFADRAREITVFALAWRETVREHAAIAKALPRIVDDQLVALSPLAAVEALVKVYEDVARAPLLGHRDTKPGNVVEPWGGWGQAGAARRAGLGPWCSVCGRAAEGWSTTSDPLTAAAYLTIEVRCHGARETRRLTPADVSELGVMAPFFVLAQPIVDRDAKPGNAIPAVLGAPFVSNLDRATDDGR